MPDQTSTLLISISNALDIPNLAKRKQNLQAAFASFVEDQYLFCLAAYDYMYTPTDLKWDGILNLFIAVKSYWELNFDATVRARIYAMTATPEIKAKLEGTTVDAKINTARAGGVRPGGVGNYNLCMKALNEAMASAFNMKQSIQTGIKGGTGKAISGGMADRMREGYARLRPYWSEKEIITFGLVVRQ